MDVAANFPIEISNTYFFDNCLGWSGLCVEAHPRYLGSLDRKRTCQILPTCVSDVDGITVSFALYLGLSGIWDTNKNKIFFQDRNVKPTMLELICTTLARSLKKHKVTKIDYLSLDVEGHELKALQGIDWDAVKISVITVEVTEDSLLPIQSFLESKNYVRHLPKGSATGRLVEDLVFIHKDVVWGKPE